MKFKNLSLLLGAAMLCVFSLAVQSSRQPTTTSQPNVSKEINASLVTVPFSAMPMFNASNAQGFKITLTGNVTSSTFASGTTGPARVVFRVV